MRLESSLGVLRNCLIAEGHATDYGGGIYLSGGHLQLDNCTLAGNSAPDEQGPGLWCGGAAGTSVDIRRSIIYGNTYTPGVHLEAGVQATWTSYLYTTDDSENPLFETRTAPVSPGDYFLNQTSSSCKDGAQPLTDDDVGLSGYSTDPDALAEDAGLGVDLGFHYPRDCDGSGIEDDWDIGVYGASDCDHDGVLDACGGAPPECTACPTAAVYTDSEDFDYGTLINVNHNTTGQLRRNQYAKPMPYINLALSGKGRILRMATRAGAGAVIEDAVGDYYTSPGGTGDPSRTAVDLDGNVWVANRADDHDYGGSVTKIGLVIGGTRCDADGADDADGDYLRPPFTYNTCCDRDGDGLLHTSRGYNQQLAWMAPSDSEREAADVYLAEDECITFYERVSAAGTRCVAVDRNNDLWVGSHTDRQFDRVNGLTGAVTHMFDPGAGGYGGLISGDGVIWSTSSPGGSVLRYDTASYAEAEKPKALET